MTLRIPDSVLSATASPAPRVIASGPILETSTITASERRIETPTLRYWTLLRLYKEAIEDAYKRKMGIEERQSDINAPYFRLAHFAEKHKFPIPERHIVKDQRPSD